MSKNDKESRTDGVINSGNVKFPSNSASYNTVTSSYSYTDKEKIISQANKKI